MISAPVDVLEGFIEQWRLQSRRATAHTFEDFTRFIERDCGHKLHTIERELVEYVYRELCAGRIVRIGVTAGRGTGKTHLGSSLELATAQFFGAQWCNLGGSLNQASRAYDYLREFMEHGELVSGTTSEPTMTHTEFANGAYIEVLAASDKSVRSPHVGKKDPPRPGGLFLDEEAEVKRQIVRAAFPIVDTAHPSIVMRFSTPHKAVGTFRELIKDPEKAGYKHWHWDVFDAAERCPFECASCPEPDFAQDRYEKDEEGHEYLKHKAWCGGRAHQSDGHLSILELAQQYRDNADYHTWVTEYMGRPSSRSGAVYDPMLIDEAIAKKPSKLPPEIFLDLEKSIGIDWGFSGQTVLSSWFKGPGEMGAELFAYDWAIYSGVLASKIRSDIVAKVLREKVRVVCCDAEDKFNNMELAAQLRAAGARCTVKEVPFGKLKKFGLGNVRFYLEKKRCHFLTSINGAPVRNWQRAIDYLKDYEQDENGEPIKENDHVADAVLCALIHFSAVPLEPVPAMALGSISGGAFQYESSRA